MLGIKKTKVYIFLIVLSLFLIEESVRLGIPAIFYGNRDPVSLERSLFFTPSDAELNSTLAGVYHVLLLEEERKVKSLYANALRLNPMLSSAWLGLAEVFIEGGEMDKAAASLRRAVDLAPFYIARRWEAALLAFRIGDRDLALENLRTVAMNDPRRRRRVFDLSWKLIADPELILSHVVSDEVLDSYLGYLISKGKLDETYPVWSRIKKMGIDSDEISLSYVDFLITKGRTSHAFSIWSDIFEANGGNSLIWNGGFEKELLNRGFDWRLGSVNGVSIDLDWTKKFKGDYSLRLKFDGEHNVNFHHISQVVPVEPETNYILTSYVAAQDITTTNGVSWEVVCHPGGEMGSSTEPVTGTMKWTKVDLTFRTPEGCDSVLLRLRRYKSNKIDRFISGTAWIDEVRIYKIGSDTDA